MSIAQIPVKKISPNSECIVLLHGLARSRLSMLRAETIFARFGYGTCNFTYPSRKHPIEKLAPMTLEKTLQACSGNYQTLHFFTHSMGGILLRYYLQHHDWQKPGRAVMVAPPNQGSEIVDKLGDLPGFKWILGPASLQLGTQKNSLPAQLGPITMETGIISGNKSINPLFARIFPGDNDGTVAVERTHLENMSDFLVLPYSHTFIMNRTEVIMQALYFYQNGHFFHPS